MRLTPTVAVAVFLCAVLPGAASQETPAFEVASIKPNKSGPGSASRVIIRPGDRVTMTNVAVHAETRSQPGYALVLVAKDGRLGSHLRRAEIECETLRAAPRKPGERDPCGVGTLANAELTWTPQNFLQRAFDRERFPSIDPDGPSIFTAIPEQLGLKLESQRSDVDVLVIDHVEHPSED